MWSTGVRKPGLNALVAIAIGVAGLLAVGWGILIMQAEGRETALSAPLIGIGLFAAIMGLTMSVVFLVGVAIYRRVARGETSIARWTVTPAELAVFREEDARRSAHGPEYHNDYTPPATSPPGGLDVIFVPNAVMIGDIFFGLSMTGLVRFDAVKMVRPEPLALEFRIRQTVARGATVRWFATETVLLRVPIAHAAMDQATRMPMHFERVLRREIIVNPGFWTVRIRIGLWTAAISAMISVAGYLWSGATGNQDIAHIMLGSGAIFAIAGLILAGGAWIQYRRQNRGR
jgi:hypothetical protein